MLLCPAGARIRTANQATNKLIKIPTIVLAREEEVAPGLKSVPSSSSKPECHIVTAALGARAIGVCLFAEVKAELGSTLLNAAWVDAGGNGFGAPDGS